MALSLRRARLPCACHQNKCRFGIVKKKIDQIKKWVRSLLVLIMILSALSGCGSENQSDAAEPSSAQASTASTAEETTAQTVENDQATSTVSAEDFTDEDTTISYPLPSNNPELTIWVSVFIGSPYSDHPVFTAAEEAAGVHIEFIETNPRRGV